jgi:anti-sigma factor RsiW
VTQRPSDLELMQYADGELESERAAEVEAWLDGSAQGRAIVASFGEIGHQVRDHADREAGRAGADSIVGDVMARLDETDHDANLGSEQSRERQRAGSETGGRVVPLPARKPTGLGTYAMAGLALAAAAALVVWQVAGPVGSPQGTAPSVLPSPSEPQMIASVQMPASDNDDREPGVSVDSIEFGAHAGTIFYVPTDTGTTTVVWLTDDETGDER